MVATVAEAVWAVIHTTSGTPPTPSGSRVIAQYCAAVRAGKFTSAAEFREVAPISNGLSVISPENPAK
jgi:hypothetical protein